ncbi:DUF6491 family protein [Caulobacter sp. D4A]|nr:DUF6491 family protein [Caulobacter sp. D4A]
MKLQAVEPQVYGERQTLRESLFMRRSVTVLSALILTAALTAPALAADTAKTKPSRREGCFFADQVRGYQVIDARTINVNIRQDEAYQLTLMRSAFDLETSTRIGVKSRVGSWICSPQDASVVVPETNGSGRYQVREIRRLTPEEYAEAWPRLKKKPKS